MRRVLNKRGSYDVRIIRTKERRYGWESGTTAELWFSAAFFSVCWCVFWFCPLPCFLCLLVLLLRTRGFLYLNLWEFSGSISLCDIFMSFFQFSEFTSGQDASPTVLYSGFVDTLPKVQASTVQQILFRGVMTPSLLLVRHRPSFDGCGTSLSVSLSLSLSIGGACGCVFAKPSALDA